ncbi:MAG TPA: glycosyl transferase, partial [Staphylococcus arlettae]|nr:glycosyl transferase [Staphylococcus arlettae]
QPTEFMNKINTSRPVIYISLGTVFNENISFFNRCFAALKDLDVTVVVSIGTTNNLANFDDIPSNFIVESYVPQIELLQYTDLFITHAGMNSTNEAMMMDVPLLAFPQSADQPVVSHQIEQLGIGKKLDSATVTTTELKTTVTEMLTNLDYYKANIAKIKQLQSTTKPGYQVAVEAILNFKKQYVH